MGAGIRYDSTACSSNLIALSFSFLAPHLSSMLSFCGTPVFVPRHSSVTSSPSWPHSVRPSYILLSSSHTPCTSQGYSSVFGFSVFGAVIESVPCRPPGNTGPITTLFCTCVTHFFSQPASLAAQLHQVAGNFSLRPSFSSPFPFLSSLLYRPSSPSTTGRSCQLAQLDRLPSPIRSCLGRRIWDDNKQGRLARLSVRLVPCNVTAAHLRGAKPRHYV
jgi:hypothetical protein